MLDAARFDVITKLFEDFAAHAAESIDGADIFGRWIEANAFRQQRAALAGRMRLDHRDVRCLQPLRQPARQHRAAHLPRAGEDDGALQSLERTS